MNNQNDEYSVMVSHTSRPAPVNINKKMINVANTMVFTMANCSIFIVEQKYCTKV